MSSFFVEPIKIEDVNPELITLMPSDMKSPFGKMVNVRYKGKNLDIILPELLCFGANYSELSNGETVSTGLSFSSANDDTKNGKRVKAALDKMVEIQRHVEKLLRAMPAKKLIVNNKLDEMLSEVEFSARYNGFVKTSAKSGNCTVNVNLQRIKKEGNKTAEFKHMFGQPLLLAGNKKEGFKPVDIDFTNASEKLPKMSRIIPVIEFAYVWCGTKISSIWQLIHGVIKTDLDGNQFSLINVLDDSDAEEEADSKRKHEDDDEEEKTKKVKTTATTAAADEEDLLLEEEEEDDDE